MRIPRTRLALVLAALMAVVVLPSAPSGAADSTTWEIDHVSIGPGVTFSRVKWVQGSNTSRPLILEIAPFANGSTVDVASASTKIEMSAKVSKMGSDHQAYGAINGDFGIKRPDHVFVEDGKMWGSGLQNGGTIFGFRKDEVGGYVGPPRTKIQYKTGTTVKEIKRWNSGKPGAGEIVAFSAEGGTPEKPPADACSVRLVNPGAHKWTSGKKAIQRTYTIEARKCSASGAMAAPTGQQIVLSSKRRGAGKKALNALNLGGTLTLKWGTAAVGAADVVGGRQHMVIDGGPGEVACDPGVGDDLCDANPRAGVGMNAACTIGPSADCRVYYVVVDGRQGATWSQGLTLANFSRFMYEVLDVDQAVNLDGGGSATMWIKKVAGLPTGSQGACQYTNSMSSFGCVVNRPSTNGSTITERGSENAVLVKPEPDSFPAAEPSGL
ncbi:MAG: phosphodiester glycosidase family protein [Actinomycetota bacterium]